MNEELQKLKEEFEQRIRELEDKYKPEEEWPKDGDDYWYITSTGRLNDTLWTDSFRDQQLLEFGNIFKTKEEAEFESERLKVLRELEKMGKPFNFGIENWYVYLNKHSDIDYSLKYESEVVYGDYYFSSYDEAKEAIDKIGEDRIKKYLFGVKEGE
ncbi:hypothetical protein [Eremococcus coleocola]|uniref:Uncharacterized protein n=1 Tax=Eremococcus coleocola ACS-139-V-Col8 TaxID=908337 RepID=E4KQJ2_9LACT|nr:hypothetical protein [Eremococcus coleocola]EFR30594.1 hypothetical protein HMPREF9257_0550 [Eremococcus coleocola ACS-139-V-Col8]